MSARTFPGVYSTVRDDSFFPNIASRFRVGLAGVAERGPLNEAVPVRSLRDFRRRFGNAITGSYLANAVQLVSDLSDGVTVVRVARQYEVITGSGSVATGDVDQAVISTPNVSAFTAGDYVRVVQIGKASTVNARVVTVGVDSLTLSANLEDTYTAADIDRSRILESEGDPTLANNAANNAEAFAIQPIWLDDLIGGGTVSAPTSDTVRVSGTKSQYEVTVEEDATDAIFGSAALAVGDTVLIEQDGSASSRELVISELVPPVPGVLGKIKFRSTNNSSNGVQALPLQDNYDYAGSGTGATIRKLDEFSTAPCIHFFASSPGTWANSDGNRTGLMLKIGPGRKADTKKITVIENGAIVEEIDNLSTAPTIKDTDGVTDIENPDFYPVAINGQSGYITVALADSTDNSSYWIGTGEIDHPANTRDGWQVDSTKINSVAFTKGYNGENVIDADYIGTVDPETELPTGLKIFEDRDANLRLDVIACPGVTSLAVAQEMDRINRVINCFSVFDSPRGYNARRATDWHNGEGLNSGDGKLDTYTIGIFWNWFLMVDSSTGSRVWVPPSCGALRAMAFTFDAFKPWYAAAGETRGLLPEALQVAYPRISEDAKQGLYGGGNCLNPVLLNRNRVMIYGNRTTQRAESKLTAINNVFLVNTVLKGMTERARKYVFDPIDDILYSQMYQDFKNFLDGVVNDRGMEQYLLRVDHSNNSADDRNNRVVNVSLALVPIDALERVFLNVAVRESGATLTSVN